MLRSFLLISFVLLTAFDQPRLVKKKLDHGITVSVPRSWRAMDDLDFSERHLSVRQPIAAFTDAERRLSFTVTTSATQWPDANRELASQFFKASISNTFDRLKMIEEGIHEVHGKTFIFFEFESRVNGSRDDLSLRDPVLQYNYLQYLVEPGRTLVFSFHAPMRLRETWQPVARTMMRSVRVK